MQTVPVPRAGERHELVDERLADVLGPDLPAVHLHPRAIGPVREHELCEPRKRERVDQSGEHGHREDHHDGWIELAAHHTTPKPETMTSMTLMPMNGTITPPAP